MKQMSDSEKAKEWVRRSERMSQKKQKNGLVETMRIDRKREKKKEIIRMEEIRA